MSQEQPPPLMNGGRFDFDDGGTYVGGWEEGKAHGHGVCTGPQGKGEYAGAWHYGFEVSGVYTWPSGNCYQGQWQNGKLHGLGVEMRGRCIYRGEWTQGYKGRYGVRQSTVNQTKYQGTWSAGYNDGYGTETYVDGGIYQGQWLRGMRHGYGMRKSATFAAAAKFRSRSHAHASMTSLRSGKAEEDVPEDDTKAATGRGGFVLRANSAAPQRRRRSLSERSLAMKRSILTGLRIKKQHSTGDIHQRAISMTGSLRSSGSTMSCTSEDSMHRGVIPQEEEQIEENVTEAYMGEWKNDSRSGFGVCERSDGLKYHGEWANNAKNGYGVTTLRDGTREEGKYKNNVLVVSVRRRGAIFVRSSKIRERVEASVEAANRAASIAQQKADIAASRTSTARERADQAQFVAVQAKTDGEQARVNALRYDPNFRPTDAMRRRMGDRGDSFGTDQSHSDYSRHPSQTQHSNMGSFEQNLSVDLPDYQHGSIHIPNHVVPNHLKSVDFQLNPNYDGRADGYLPHNQPSEFTEMVGSARSTLDPNDISLVQSSSQQVTNPAMMQNQMHSTIQGGYSTQQPQQPQQQQQQAPGFQSPFQGGLGPGYQQNYTTQQTYQAQQGPNSGLNQIPAGKPPEPPKSQTTIQQPQTGLSTQTLQQGPQTSSRFSLSDDHFDQYVMPGSPQEPPRLRRNRPSLMRQADVNDPSAALNRRSTLASARDRKADAPPEQTGADNMGSLPNLADLENTGVRLRREEAARLASNRRQEVLRDQEDQEMLRQNPLRYLTHPNIRQWVMRYKVPLLLALANLALLALFYNLLTYEKKRGQDH